jgi:adenylyltransferase/sulfurtransferase
MQLPYFGEQGQSLLFKAKILIIGAGGLGCPCIQYLVAAGAGCIGICDGDRIEKSNLHRQILFTTRDIGQLKTHVVMKRLQHVNDHLQIRTYAQFLNNELALELFPQYDLIIDCTDDLQTRLLISDACVLLQKPLIYGAVFQLEGQVAVFNTDDQHINLRDLFNDLQDAELTNCNESGTLGVVTGLVGTMQAAEAIKLICGSSGLLSNEMLICNFKTYDQFKIKIPQSAASDLIPVSIDDFLKRNYLQACSNSNIISHSLDQDVFFQKINEGNVQVIDVRNEGELPEINLFQHERIPLNDLLKHPERVDRDKTVLLFCHAGIRSQTALDFLIEECNINDVYHLKGGLLKLNSI